MLIDLKKYFSGEDISQAIDYTVDLSEVEIVLRAAGLRHRRQLQGTPAGVS